MFLRTVLIIVLNFILPGWGLAAATGRWVVGVWVFLAHMAVVYFPAHLMNGRSLLTPPELLLVQLGTWTLLTTVLSIGVLKFESRSEETQLDLSASLIFLLICAVCAAAGWLRGGALFVTRWVVASDDALGPSFSRGEGAFCTKPSSGGGPSDAERYLGKIGLFEIGGQRVLRRVLAVGSKEPSASGSLQVEPVSLGSSCFKAGDQVFVSRVAQSVVHNGRLDTALLPGTVLVGIDSPPQSLGAGELRLSASEGHGLRAVSMRSLICLLEPTRLVSQKDSCP
jgi:hypothetical protein